MSVAVIGALCVRRLLGAALVVALGLACTTLLMMGTASAPGQVSSMSSMSMSGETNIATMTGMHESSLASSPPAVATESAIWPALAQVCDMPCLEEVTDACTGVAGLTATSLLVLFLGTRRDTFLGLLARDRYARTRRPHEPRPPWTVLSLYRLGVLRV